DRFGHWEPGIVWLGGDAPPELEALAHDVREAIRAYDFSFDRKRFKPHVTLLRNARRAAQSQTVKPLGWPVDRFLLVESVTESAGARYHILAEFPCLA
ncbi:MAG: 2'-5' RNA ligase family protein, partial [Burkholderiales bacterium]|nr:2'-5' RNA ligase family protein [Burkholderiales bacterium]